ncbi:cysteine-rich and transmembrane domain-containing protein 1-like [Mytilus californianus]|uniref:cysteine-rich and transmembrane domain-containing protein 1-like n=1 Tax=Mytilus californianus TaxID=6549 RepID=UPI002246224F|nr:cysteine-rich and transmembrane domain-containing protein 1-like [Mytilus californianus]
MAAPYGQGPPPQYNVGPGNTGPGIAPPPFGYGGQQNGPGIAPPPFGYGGQQNGPGTALHPPGHGPEFAPPPSGYGGYPQPPQQYGGYQQTQQNTVIIAGQPTTVIHQQKRERFADNICINLVLIIFFPFWIFVWICLCMFEK